MFLLTRETRFGLQPFSGEEGHPTNSHAGSPPVLGFCQYVSVRATLGGNLNPRTAYVQNIKDIDHAIRSEGVKLIQQAVRDSVPFAAIAIKLFDRLRFAWNDAQLISIEISLSPFLSASCLASEYPMVRLNQKFEFSAAHRLHNPQLSDAENQTAYGKCNNPLGHGHNYEVQVSLVGHPDKTGLLIEIPQFEKIVASTVIDRFDHKFLNLETEEFRDVIPSVENIAAVIYRLLKPRFVGSAKLASVTVWETPKTWCEYSE